ncbi:MAG: hypothetical protein COW29_04510 [Rhodobacterales bacterium CG15_BIG_FIL_POST_REV_8_21_14_020_59_13]|nr:MAG: hypothetical protein COW29_04510 [Rhodobacterales bacterium CG15_BIG_FIL_POST_REV_8_21_14_020_59_13]
MIQEDETPSSRMACWRGFRLICPQCRQEKLFSAYLKPVEACPVCGTDYSQIRADDGPVWLTSLSLDPVSCLWPSGWRSRAGPPLSPIRCWR